MPANTNNDADASDSGSSESSLVWGTSSFEPGSDVGLVSRHTVGLIERNNPSTRDRLWQLVADDAPLDDILDELSSTGLKALPDFGIAQVEGDAVRVVARGRTTITAELASGEHHEIDPSGVRTWIEEVVADVVGLTISLSPLGDDESALSAEAFAVLAGSVPARSVTRRFDVADLHAEDAIAGWSATPGAPAAGPDGEESNGHVDDDLEPVAAPASAPELDAAEDVELEMLAPDDGEEGSAEGDSWFADAADAPAADVPPQPGAPTDMDSADQPPADPQQASPQPSGPPPVAAPASPQPSGPPPAGAQPVSPQPSGPPPAGAQPVSPQPSGPPPAGAQPVSPQPSGPPAGVGATADPIEAPTDAGPAGPPSGPGTGGPAPEATVVVGSDDGPVRGPVSSIFDDDVVAEPFAPALPPDDRTRAPDAAAADLGDTAAPAAPPVHGVLAFSNGERIGVDRSVLIGRNPKVAGAVEGGLPHIMKFDGPGQGLSRTHAEVRIENGEMLLEDLQSTNGTEIQLPGQQRRRLRGGEPVVVVPGTLIDFGDELHCTVETAG